MSKILNYQLTSDCETTSPLIFQNTNPLLSKQRSVGRARSTNWMRPGGRAGATHVNRKWRSSSRSFPHRRTQQTKSILSSPPRQRTEQTTRQRKTRVPAVDEEGRIQTDYIVLLFLLVPLPRAPGVRHSLPHLSPAAAASGVAGEVAAASKP